jgi:hypothetical protein
VNVASASTVRNKISSARQHVNQIQWQSGHDREIGHALKSILDVLEEIAQVLRDRKSAADEGRS